MQSLEALEKQLEKAKQDLESYRCDFRDCDAKGAERYLIQQALYNAIQYYQEQVNTLSKEISELKNSNHQAVASNARVN